MLKKKTKAKNKTEKKKTKKLLLQWKTFTTVKNLRVLEFLLYRRF